VDVIADTSDEVLGQLIYPVGFWKVSVYVTTFSVQKLKREVIKARDIVQCRRLGLEMALKCIFPASQSR